MSPQPRSLGGVSVAMQRSVLVSLVAALAGNAGCYTGAGGAAPAGRAQVAAKPELPLECKQQPVGEGEPPWVPRPQRVDACLGAQRAPGGEIVLLRWDAVQSIGRDGRVRWTHSLRGDTGGGEGRGARSTTPRCHSAALPRPAEPSSSTRCGFPRGLAVAVDGRVVVACGYQLLALDEHGARLWQAWPAGDHHVSAPLVDRDGTIYTSASGVVYAVRPDGTTRWSTSVGFNRYIPQLAVAPDGALLAYSLRDELHTPPDYEYEPELLLIGRDGAIRSREPAEQGREWPAWLDVRGERGGRIP